MAAGISSHDLVHVRIEIEGLPEDAFSVASLDGREAISKLFEIEVTAVSTQGIDAEALLGQRATLVFLRGDDGLEVRRMFGIIAAVHDGFESESAHWTCRFSFRPRAHRMTLQETLDIFLDLTVPEIVEKKLQAAGLAKDKDYDLRLASAYPKREFVVQYKETDLAFVSRLTEHLGISFFFEHRDDRDVFVLTDHNGGFEAVEKPEALPFRPRGDLRDVYRLESTARMIPSEYLVRDYNYRTPQVELAARADVDGAGGRVVEYGAHFKTNEEAGKIAKIRSEEQLAARRVLDGESDAPALQAGLALRLEGHPWGDMELLVTEVSHTITQVALGGVADARRYTNRFHAIRKATTYRPPRVTPKPKVPGVITGVVDAAKVGQYAEIDNEGRYKVKFLFDTSEAPGGQASRAIRMMQPHSGAGYGMHFPLRPGIEVLIVCVDGDPDRPIIAGTVPNPQTASPVVAGNAPRNIIRTGGNNEINIDDTEDAQRIKLTTPRRNTLLQLGYQNDPIDGISLKTDGHASTFAVEGASQWNSFGTQMSAMVNLLRSGTILNVASSPTLLGLTAAGVGMAQAVVVGGMPGVQELYGRNKSWIAQEQQNLLKAETEVNALAVQASQAAKAQQEGCNACKLAAKKLFPPRPTPVNPGAPTPAEQAAMTKYDQVKERLQAYDAAANACDDGYLTAIGTQEDRNAIVDINRTGFGNANFEPVMNRDAYSAVSVYDYPMFETVKATEDLSRWNNFTDAQRQAITDQGITQAQWLAEEKKKWITTPLSDSDLAYYAATKDAADSAAFDAKTPAQKDAIPASVWAAAGITGSAVGHYDQLTDAQKANLKTAWLADELTRRPTPDLRAIRDQRRDALTALLTGDSYYAAFTTKLADCSAKCGTQLDQARRAAMDGNEAYFRKMRDDVPRMQHLMDLSNQNDQALVTHMGTAINGLLAVMAALETFFARTSLIERWAAATLKVTGATTAAEFATSDVLKTVADASKEVAKWAIPFYRPQHTNVVGSDASTEVYGQRDLCMWSETAMLLGMGSASRWGGKAGKAAAAASIVGVPLPGDKPDPTKGKVLILGMESVHVLSRGLLRMQADDKLVAMSRDKASLLVKQTNNDQLQAHIALEKGKISQTVLNDNVAAPAEKASFTMALSNDKGVVELKATGEHVLKLDEDTQKTTLFAGQTNKLELNAQANTAELLSSTWKLKLAQGNDKGVELGDAANYLKIKDKEIKVGGAGAELLMTDKTATLGTFEKVTLAGTTEIKFETPKVIFGAAVIDSANLMVKGDYDPQLAQLTVRAQAARQSAIAANASARAAQRAAAEAQRTADVATAQANAAHRRINRL